MGGHAFQDCQRLTEADVARVVALVVSTLMQLGSPAAAAPPELADKESYGDVDVVFVMPPGAAEGDSMPVCELDAAMASALGSFEPPVINGRVRSFLTSERFQVDLIQAESSEFETTKAFMSHADLSAIMGNEVTRWGLKLGMDGLSLDLSSSEDPAEVAESGFTVSRQQARVWLSSDMIHIYSFLGLPLRLADGQTRVTLSEMLAALMASPFFDQSRHASKPGHAMDPAVSKSKRQQAAKREVWAKLAALCAEKAPEGTVIPSTHPLCVQFAHGLPAFAAEFAALHLSCAQHFGQLAALEERRAAVATCHARGRLHKRARDKLSGATLQAWYPELSHESQRAVGQLLQEMRSRVLANRQCRARGPADGGGEAGNATEVFDAWVLATHVDDIRALVDDVRTSPVS